MFDDKLKDDIIRLDDTIREQWRLYKELWTKLNGLYEKDAHDTERPKVDILSDDIRNEIWHEIHELRSRIVELEKK